LFNVQNPFNSSNVSDWQDWLGGGAPSLSLNLRAVRARAGRAMAHAEPEPPHHTLPSKKHG